MSELKVHRFLGQDEVWPDANLGSAYYLKSEADKVIAEKDAKIARLKAIRKVHVKAIESMGAGLQQDEEEILHQKYKRCLTMAEVCKHKRWRADVCDEQGYDYARSTNQMNRWLELAEKFKPNKSTAQ